MNRDETRKQALRAGWKGCNAIDIREYGAAIERFEDAIEALEEVTEESG